MQVSLKSLKLKNFKGIDDFSMSLNGNNTISVFGDNATGKTSIFDGVTWLIFGKDSLNRTDFEIKKIDHITGKPITGMDHEVEAVIKADDKEITLKKVLVEKWVKRRGSATKEFTGHQVDHFIDGVPVKKKEFDATVTELCDENLFKLLSNPRYFNETMHWQERRKLLLEVCGDITDDDVIASSKNLSSLPDVLGKRSLEDHRKVIKARMPEINRELEKIPVRIDEAERSKNLDVRDKKQLEDLLHIAKNNRVDLAEKLSVITSGGEIALKFKALTQAQADLQAHENKIAADRQKQESETREKRKAMQFEVDKTERAVSHKTTDIEDLHKTSVSLQNSISTIRSDMDRLRAKWHEINTEQFTGLYKEPDICPSCGQKLPEEQVNAAREKAQQAFNQQKADRIKENVGRGTKLKTELESVRSTLQKNETEIHDAESILDNLKQELEKARKALKVFDDQTSAVHESADPERDHLQGVIDNIKIEIDLLKQGAEGDAEQVKADIEVIDSEISQLQTEIVSIQNNEKIDSRIDALKTDERKLAEEFERLEYELNLTDKFVQTKVNLLEENINSKFRLARFKLFSEQINGGLAECCEAIHEGVPYGSLNNAMRINIGLDICNTLSKHYGVSVPCFIDNAEAVTDILKTDSQQVLLIVSADDKQLRVQ